MDNRLQAFLHPRLKEEFLKGTNTAFYLPDAVFCFYFVLEDFNAENGNMECHYQMPEASTAFKSYRYVN